MVRPSRRSTIKRSLVNRTPFTLSPGLGIKEAIPRLQKVTCVPCDESFNTQQPRSAETEVPCKCHWLKPELRRAVFPVHMNVRRLPCVVAHEVDPVRALTQYSRHSRRPTSSSSLLPQCACGRTQRQPNRRIKLPPSRACGATGYAVHMSPSGWSSMQSTRAQLMRSVSWLITGSG